MAHIDPTTNLGKLRLRVADYGDIPFLPDSVYTQTLADNDNNLIRTAKIIASYLLGMLAHKTHRKLSQIEIYGEQAFKNYQQFLLLTFTNPAFMMDISPIPYSGSSTDVNPLIKFTEDWNNNYSNGTQSQQLALDALAAPSATLPYTGY